MVKLTIRLDSFTDRFGLIRKEKLFTYNSFNDLDIEKARILVGEIQIIKRLLDKKMGELINNQP